MSLRLACDGLSVEEGISVAIINISPAGPLSVLGYDGDISTREILATMKNFFKPQVSDKRAQNPADAKERSEQALKAFKVSDVSAYGT